MIHNGEVLGDHLCQELMTEGRLQSKLRGHGVRDPAEVADAYLEGDGSLTVLRKADYPREQAFSEDVHETPACYQAQIAAHLKCIEKLTAALAKPWAGGRSKLATVCLSSQEYSGTHHLARKHKTGFTG
jgi:uncharacterized membrane protein YcaP (DUF421 family)